MKISEPLRSFYGKKARHQQKLLINLKLYLATASSKTVVYQWVDHFKTGLEPLEDEPCPGHPSTFVNKQTTDLVEEMLVL